MDPIWYEVLVIPVKGFKDKQFHIGILDADLDVNQEITPEFLGMCSFDIPDAPMERRIRVVKDLKAGNGAQVEFE